VITTVALVGVVAVFLALALTAYAVYFVEGRNGSWFRWP
jgi:hypothetical protein